MKLRYNPYQIFVSSNTPAGLYARKKWLEEAATRSWKHDYGEVLEWLWANQSTDGSWHQSPLETIKRLFALHLTVRESSDGIETALNWLLEKINLQGDKIKVVYEGDLTAVSMRGLPFAAGRQDTWMVAAVLFLATIFSRERDPTVLALYQWLSAEGVKNKGLWFDRISSHNIFRAMVVHPVFAQDKATASAVEYLADLQTDRGDWQNELPFYQTLNALAHLELAQADTQLEKAFKWLFENQNSGGTWSRSEPEWNTFLAIHALKNKGIL
jgi:hypothetical protein